MSQRHAAAQNNLPAICRPAPPPQLPTHTKPPQNQYKGGVIIDASALPADAGAFGAALDASLARWLASGKRGVWLKLPLASAGLVPTAAARGFDFHHAERGHVMMTRWLPRDAQSTLPPNASHQVGVGAFVVNGRGEVLVVQEANGPLKGKGVYKMPTGLVHAGEDIIDAAVREVAEETGIVATPDAVIAVRQAHNFAFGKSDAFFCVGMRAAGDQEPRPCVSAVCFCVCVGCCVVFMVC
jgi:ADP-ribose pyrophosphatase YjhB (NUDIX family)